MDNMDLEDEDIIYEVEQEKQNKNGEDEEQVEINASAAEDKLERNRNVAGTSRGARGGRGKPKSSLRGAYRGTRGGERAKAWRREFGRKKAVAANFAAFLHGLFKK